MSGDEQKIRICDQCGAVISNEELRRQAAARYHGRLLCPRCVQELKARLAAGRHADAHVPSPTPVPTVSDVPAAGEQARPVELGDAPLALVESDEQPSAEVSTRLHGFSGGEMTVSRPERHYNRALLRGPHGATRCRTFHCKLTDASFQHLNDQINEWVDQRDDIEIKFAVNTVGVVEGKHADPHLIVTIFY